MGRVASFTPRSLVMGVLLENEGLLETAVTRLETQYGPVLNQSPLTLFTYTDYYDREMGTKPHRCYLQFRTLVDPARLSTIKIETNALEDLFRNDIGRRGKLESGRRSLVVGRMSISKERGSGAC